MVWERSERKIWTDGLDGVEAVFYDISQAFKPVSKEHASVYCVCTIRTADSKSVDSMAILLRKAWKKVRIDFPALAVTVPEGSRTKRYEAATPENLEQWAKETFFVKNDDEQHAAAVLQSVHLRQLPALFYLPHSAEVALHSSHWRIDALGACMVMNRLLDHVACASRLDDIAFEEGDAESERLSPSLEDAAGCAREPDAATHATAMAVRKRNFETSYPSAGLSIDQEGLTAAPSYSHARAIELSAESTATLLHACKAARISVTAAAHAACAQAVFDGSKDSSCGEYSTIVSVNLRDRLPPPYSSAAFACATYVTGITHTVQRGGQFVEQASRLTKAYRGDWDVDGYVPALRAIYREHGKALREVAVDKSRVPATVVTVSSLGVVEQYLQKEHSDADGMSQVSVEKFQLGSAIMAKAMTLYVWTFGGRLSLSLNANAAYFGTARVDALLYAIAGVLERELRVELAHSPAQ